MKRDPREPGDPANPAVWWAIVLCLTLVPIVALFFGGWEVALLIFVGTLIVAYKLLDEIP
jgi:4-hydroxybenzoate polyprenyltransferase